MAEITWDVSENIIRQIVSVIKEETDPEMILLFGSRAKGNADGNSDLDLIVVEPAPFGRGRSRRKEMEKLWRALSGFRVPKDILVYSKDELEKFRNSQNHILGQSLKQGRILYERP